MAIPLPDLDDPTDWVHHVTRRGLAAGGRPGSLVAAFDGERPVLLVRPGDRHDHVHEGVCEVLGIIGMIGVDAVLVTQPMWLRDPDATGVARDSTAQTAVLVTRGRSTADEVVVTATVHGYDLGDDGHPCWTEVMELDEPGPMGPVVSHVLGLPPVPEDQRRGVVYAADRFGHGVGADPAWAERHLTGPLPPSELRREDRRRGRRFQRTVTGGRR